MMIKEWWNDYLDLITSKTFISLLHCEAHSSMIRTWHQSIIPGILQTEDYASAMLQADGPWQSA